MEILLNCMEVLWLCSFSSFRSLSISSLRARFSDSCLLRMLLISAQTCAMKIPTFFLQSRQSSLQLVPSSSVLIDSFRKVVLIVKIQYQNNSITQQVGQHLDIPPKEGLLFLLKKLITIILDCCKSPISMTTQADFAELLNKSEEVNLKLRTRVIELENDLNHEKIRAKEYEDKYRDAMLQSQYSEGQDLLEKLNNKENELNECRRQIIELNRRLTNTANSPSQSDLIALAQENEELMANIDEIKNAAISAIMVKEEEIEELNKTINRYELIENQLKFQYEKYESLEREFEIGLKEKQEEIDELNQKIARERENFFNKLEIIQKEATQEESFKQSLLEKAQDLEGNLEKSQMVINEYEHRITELENTLNQQKIGFEHEKVKINFEIEDLKQNIKSYEKEEKNWNKIFEELKSKQKQSQEQITKLNELNEQLTHKLSIKKKKDNKQIKDKITSSFSGIQKANPVYASFAFRTKDSIYQENEPKHLGGIPEIQDLGGMIENVNFEDMKELPEEKKETPLSKVMSKKKEKTSEVVQAKQENTSVALPSDLAKQIQGYKQSIIRLEAEKKELQISLNDLYGQMQKINESLVSVTNDLQQERKNSAVLREQLKKTKKESQLIVEIQSLNLHVEKLQNDMIASKLKYAEEADFAREKYNREKVIWTQKLVQLTEKIAKQDLQITQKEVKTQEKKKKKGFFG